MKQNGYDKRIGDYYVGLDVGTDSVGWAATDLSYELKKFRGNGMWGIRLFDEGETAADRRLNRTNRRRLARRKWRLHLLRELFDGEIEPGFFLRLEESFLKPDSKSGGSFYTLFADPNYTDAQYHHDYPTVYHLRSKLMKTKEPQDVRLVYLALHHIIKSRGHFLYSLDENDNTFESAWTRLSDALGDICNISVTSSSATMNTLHNEILSNEKLRKSEKIKQALSLLSYETDEHDEKTAKKILEKALYLVVGGSVKPADLFANEAYAELQTFSLDADESVIDDLARSLGDDAELVFAAKSLRDVLYLEKITRGSGTVSEYKIKQYEQHAEDLRLLKQFLAAIGNPALKKEILTAPGCNNYAAYSGHGRKSGERTCSQEDFCKFLRAKLSSYRSLAEEDPRWKPLFDKIEDNSFAPKLRTRENGDIPSSLHRQELCKILENAKTYLPFLSRKDEAGRTTADKILAIFDYKLPYYVGPLAGPRGWTKRTSPGAILPWNLEEKIDFAQAEEGFISRMTSLCTYTGEDVLPKDSLLYSEYMVLNEINPLKVNGTPISLEAKKKVYEELFVKRIGRVTKKKIADLLISEGYMKAGDSLSGVDDTIKSSLTSYHKLARILPLVGQDLAEEIIRRVVLFGNDRKCLSKWLQENTPLSEEDIRYVSRLGFKDWGRLSRVYLAELMEVDPATGETRSVIDCLRETGETLMQLQSDRHSFAKLAEEHRRAKAGEVKTPFEMVENLYVSPKIRRSIWQTLCIMDEIVDAQKAAPKKIFIEVARDQDDKNDKKRTTTRKDKLLDLYRACGRDKDELFERLESEEEGKLRKDKLFLYYTQFGMCAYSGTPLDIEKLDDNGYCDIDHIYPRSKIKDDSLDNRVLVLSVLNREKSDRLLSSDIREKMRSTWKMWLDRETITQKKYERLTRTTELTEEELTAFVNRQLVETRQSTKALAELLHAIYPDTKIVYSKAGNVSDFRDLYGIRKCRDTSDLHHAHDAYLNIVVGNYFDTRFTQEFLHNITREKYSLKTEVLYTIPVPGAWVPGDDGTIATVRRTMAKNNILFTRKPEEGKGKLFDVTILPAGGGQIPIKTGLSLDTYGGYNSATGVYFVLVEKTEKKKTVRSLEAVWLLDKVAYEKDPDAFAKKTWGETATVILPRVLNNSLIEYDGFRFHLAGRSSGQLVLNPACQLYLSLDETDAFRRRLKYLERCDKAKTVLPRGDHEQFTKEENMVLYDLLARKAGAPPYSRTACFTKLHEDMQSQREKVAQMEEVAQCKILREALKTFRCNAMMPKADGINLGLSTRIRISKVLSSKNHQVFLINQSVTGLYEQKIDLIHTGAIHGMAHHLD